jgi:hypothetical protein
MITLGGVYNPVILTHHVVQTLEETHIESGTDYTDHQKQCSVG